MYNKAEGWRTIGTEETVVVRRPGNTLARTGLRVKCRLVSGRPLTLQLTRYRHAPARPFSSTDVAPWPAVRLPRHAFCSSLVSSLATGPLTSTTISKVGRREREKKAALTKVKDVSGEQLLVRLRSVLKRRASGHRVHSRHRHAWLMVQELSSRPKVFF